MTGKTILAAAIAVTALASPLVAQDERDAPTVKVAYRDLNLATPQGQHAFRSRIAHAITAMCGTADGHDLMMSGSISHCRSVAQASAAPQVAMLVDRAQQLAQRDAGDLRIASR